MYIGKEQIKELKEKIDIRIIADLAGLGDRFGEWFYCPLHEADNKENHNPSCKYYEDTNTLCCFVCKNERGKCEVFDTIRLYTLVSGTEKTNFNEICSEMYQDLSQYFELSEKEMEIKRDINKKIKVNKTQDIESRLKYTKSIHDLHTENKYFLDEYLNKRCISYSRIKKYLDLNGIQIRGNYYNNINSIFIYDKINNFMLQRQINDYLNKGKLENKKFNVGNPNITKIKCSDNYKHIAIFEGIYDCLSFLSNVQNIEDYMLLCLNSVNNVEKIWDIVDNFNDEIIDNNKDFIIITDNDDAGDYAYLKLKRILEDDLAYNISRANLGEYKDFNEYIISLKKGV